MPETIAQSPTVLSRELDDGLVLYQPTTDDVTHLDHVATVVWNHLTGHPTKAQLVAGLVAEFDAEPTRVAADIDQLIVELVEADLIVVSDDPDTRDHE